MAACQVLAQKVKRGGPLEDSREGECPKVRSMNEA